MKRTSQPGQAVLGLEEHLTAFFEPTACKKQETESSMTQFYTMQLREANTTVEILRSKVTRLMAGNQSKVNTLQEKLTDLRIENQALKSKVELLQMKLKMSSARMTFTSQPAPFCPSASGSAAIQSNIGEMDPSL